MFVERLLASLDSQTFQDFEVVMTEEGKMAENTNAAIKKAKGDIVKILYMDDYLNHPNALQNIVDAFQGGWLVTGCEHQESRGTSHGPLINAHFPIWNPRMALGENTIGSPSVLAFENDSPLLFDENLSWLLDCDLYSRLYDRYGPPTVLHDLNVVIGLGPHQVTHTMPDEAKRAEYTYLHNKNQ